MTKRFSWLAFIIATLIHVAGMTALFDASFRSLAELKRTGVDPHPVLLVALGWLWEPLPMLLAYVFPVTISFYGPLLLVWSLCVGALFGFLAPHLSRWRRQVI